MTTDELRAENDRLRDAIMTMAACLQQHRSAESAIWAIRQAANDKRRPFSQDLVDEYAIEYRTKIDELKAALREACDLFYTEPEQLACGFDPAPRIAELRKLADDDRS